MAQAVEVSSAEGQRTEILRNGVEQRFCADETRRATLGASPRLA